MIRLPVALIGLALAGGTRASEPVGLHSALSELNREGRFSGAVVISKRDGRIFARGYGLADPFAGQRFQTTTPVDSASIAKPVTAATVLMLARAGRIDLDLPARRYVMEFPHPKTTVRQLLAHSAGLELDETPEALAGKSNSQLLSGISSKKPTFDPGSRFAYCNICYSALALIVERATGRHLLTAAREYAGLPATISIRPQRLADWPGRAIGYRRRGGQDLERFDSWEGEAWYGPANLSLSAQDLAGWGALWSQQRMRAIIEPATEPARIGGGVSGLSLGNWYCSRDRQRCHYPGHHEGFHHLLYWNRARGIAVAMVSNNTLHPALQQRLQRALVAFAEGRAAAGRSELRAPPPTEAAEPGRYRIGSELLVVTRMKGPLLQIERRGVRYTGFPIADHIHYVPGLDAYLWGTSAGDLRVLTLYEDLRAVSR